MGYIDAHPPNMQTPMTATGSITLEHTHRRQMINRLKRVEGQLRGIQKMVDTGTDCAKIAQQLAAARKALDRSFYEMIGCSLVATLANAPDLEHARTEGADWAQILAKFG